MMRTRPIHRLILLATLLLAGAAWSEEPARPRGPAIERLVWLAPHRVRWRMTMGPMWFSMGHTSRLVCLIPRGVRLDDGKAAPTADGRGSVYAVDIDAYAVDAFDEKTGLPVTSHLLARSTVRADDPEGLKRKRWRFPTEQGKDFELSELPARKHEALYRVFLHDKTSQFWYTLMVHTEADLAPTPALLATAAKSEKCFKDFTTHIVVCELLLDPTIKLTSKYIEPDDPPSTWWIEKEKVKAPWALNRDRLAPASGTLRVDAAGTLTFAPLSDEARVARKAFEDLVKPKQPDPKLPTGSLDEMEPVK